MPNGTLADEERPTIAFRIGVSGESRLHRDDSDRLRPQVVEALSFIREEVFRCAIHPAAKRAYRAGVEPSLRIVSPLADGADRLVAEAAINEGFKLETPLPFERGSYEETFSGDNPDGQAESKEQFALLLRKAESRVLTLDGESTDPIDRARSYGAVGRLVVRNCDLLIAIWDNDKPARGRGGTSDVVSYALRVGIPVLWLHAKGTNPPRLLRDFLDLPRVGLPKSPVLDVHAELRLYISQAVLPPEVDQAHKRGVRHRIVACLRCMLGIEGDPLLAYLLETVTGNTRIWRTHSFLIGLLRRHGERCHIRRISRIGGTHPIAPVNVNQKPHTSARASSLSLLYQERYRTSYLFVFLFGTLAVVAAVIGLPFTKIEPISIVVEFISLLGILVLVVQNRLCYWHDRYVSYRILGELKRITPYLHALGWSVPGARVSNTIQDVRHRWVIWLFSAGLRAMPLEIGEFTKERLERARDRAVDDLLRYQIGFQASRYRRSDGAAHLLGDFGRVLFVSTFLLSALHLLGEYLHWQPLTGRPMLIIGILCAVLPAASAACFGLRAYEEFEILADQSSHMVKALERAIHRLGRVDLDRPLASQALGEETLDIATIMLSEVTGWVQTFQMKAVEA